MLGQIAFGLWVAAVTLAGIYAGQNVAVSDGSAAHEADNSGAHGASPGFNEFRTDLFAIPHLEKSGIVGYLTGRFTIRTVAAEEAEMKIPLNTLIFDSLNRHFYAEAGSFATSEGWERLRESLASLRAMANETAGREVVAEVLIEQLDYFSKDDIRMGEGQSFAPATKEE